MTLYLISGPWTSSKTSLIPHLQRLLPECVVFNWDMIIPGLSRASQKDVLTDPSSWDGLKATWVAIINAVLSGGHEVLLCDPMTPAELEPTSLQASSVRCLYLDWPDEVLSERLKARGVAENEIAEELQMVADLRASSYHALPGSGRAPHQLAQAVAAWARQSQS